MEDYLSGYLQVLPDYQRRKIEEIVKDNKDLYNFNSITEEQFQQIIDRLEIDHEQLSEFIPQLDKLDEELFNSFFSNVHVDLNLMFLESQLLENANANYGRIFDGIISDLQKEVNALSSRVNSLRMVSEGEDGLIVKEYSFSDKSQMETNVEENKHLFLDRDQLDGEEPDTPMSVIERNHDNHYLVLAKTKEMDCIRDRNGNPTAKIQVTDRRGIPVKKVYDGWPLDKAIDGDPDSYWAEVVLTDEPLHLSMNK
jgi:hypothetical protein